MTALRTFKPPKFSTYSGTVSFERPLRILDRDDNSSLLL